MLVSYCCMLEGKSHHVYQHMLRFCRKIILCGHLWPWLYASSKTTTFSTAPSRTTETFTCSKEMNFSFLCHCTLGTLITQVMFVNWYFSLVSKCALTQTKFYSLQPVSPYQIFKPHFEPVLPHGGCEYS